jgi:hypothetical protein
MRVYVPSKEEDVIAIALKDLYMLKKAIDYETGSPASRIAMVDKIRDNLRGLLKAEEASESE